MPAERGERPSEGDGEVFVTSRGPGRATRRWCSGRPERATLALLLAAASLGAAIAAILPRTAVESVLAAVLPSSSSGAARTLLLDRHREVFGALTLGAGLLLLFLPRVGSGVLGLGSLLTHPPRWKFLAAVFASALVSRAVLAPAMLPIVIGDDSAHYWQLANTLLDEGRFIEYAQHPNEPDGYRAWRTPAYPAALAVSLALTGRAPWTPVALNAVLLCILAGAVYVLVLGTGGEMAARFAAVGCVLYPRLVTASLDTMNELMFCTLLVSAVAVLFLGRGSILRAGAGGILIGLATLTRGNGLLLFLAFVPILFVRWALAGRRDDREAQPVWRTWAHALRPILAIVAGFSLVVGPWTVRNRVVLGEWIPVATSGGRNMWIGHHPGSTGLHEEGNEGEVPEGLSEVEIHEYSARKAMEYWLSNPVDNLKASVRAVVEIVKVDSGLLSVVFPEGRPSPGSSGIVAYVALFGLTNLLYYGMWLLLLVWLVTAVAGKWSWRASPGILALVIVLYLGTYVPFIGWARYKVPALPLLIGGASIVLVCLASRKDSASSIEDSGGLEVAGVAGSGRQSGPP